mmetsp:Transcript_25504/g.37678  ORF Transcript_25504/g.37678 Transcript_25504/m.37678 type:complete len:150 (-) Transcript_25504:2-451(-)
MNRRNSNDRNRTVTFNNEVDVIILEADSDTQNRWYSGREIRKMKKERFNLSLNYQSILARQENRSVEVSCDTNLLSESEIILGSEEGKPTNQSSIASQQQQSSQVERGQPIELLGIEDFALRFENLQKRDSYKKRIFMEDTPSFFDYLG